MNAYYILTLAGKSLECGSLGEAQVAAKYWTGKKTDIRLVSKNSSTDMLVREYIYKNGRFYKKYFVYK